MADALRHPALTKWAEVPEIVNQSASYAILVSHKHHWSVEENNPRSDILALPLDSHKDTLRKKNTKKVEIVSIS